ncbi:FimV/HubP family polar landmark protein, partial [Pseudoalteromonas sp. SG44-8]|uniref:FimV/HubP family polar landmark protein n=1 Tax=Pseudoalteromonas sp. SG44-8 TaxID=2760958 RepID=UPI0018203DE5
EDELVAEEELIAEDEPVVEDELVVEDEPVVEDELTDALEDEYRSDFATELEDPLEQSLSDDQLDDDFMADLTQTDFDALLSELAEPESLEIDDSSEFEVDFNALLSEDLATLEELSVPDDMPSAEQLSEDVNASTNEDIVADEFVDIDALIEQSDDTSLDYEPYDDVNMDVGLSEFDALLAGDNPTDVDAESGGYSAKLDLARAYIEIGDMDAALDAIDEVIANGPEEVQEEAQSLKAKLL